MSRAYATGLVFIGLVAIIWALSSVLVQYLYADKDFHSPFLVTYIGVSLFTLWLPTEQVIAYVRRHWWWGRNNNDQADSSAQAGAMATRTDNKTAYQNIPSTHDDDDDDDDDEHELDNDEHCHNPNDDLALPAIVPTTLHVLSNNNNNNNNTPAPAPVPANIPWTNEQHVKAACYIAPVWFLANWTYNTSLAFTSITSSTVLASTGSLFTFCFAVATKDENFSGLKLLGVLLGVCGSCLTTLQDTHSSSSVLLLDDAAATSNTNNNNNNNQRPLLGDILGLISAVGYGAYAVQTRLLCPHDESLYSMQRLLGYIGLINLVVLFPIAAYQLLVIKVELSGVIFGFLIVKGLFDNVLSDYLWLRAVILINATVATVGLGLTIPLAFASDVILGKTDVLSVGTVVGAITVLAGFVLVNIGNEEEEHAVDGATVPPPAAIHPIEETEDHEAHGVSLQARPID